MCGQHLRHSDSAAHTNTFRVAASAVLDKMVSALHLRSRILYAAACDMYELALRSQCMLAALVCPLLLNAFAQKRRRC